MLILRRRCGATSRSGVLDGGDLELEGDLVADQHATSLETGVPADAPVPAVDDDGALEAGAEVAVRVGLEGSVTVNRKDWGVSWNAPLEAGGILVSEKITLEFEISATKNQEQ